MNHSPSSIVRLGGFAGMAWAAINIVGGFAAGPPPALDATGDAIRSYVSDNRSPLMWGAAAFAATIPLLITFVASLLSPRPAEPDERSRTITTVASVGLAVQVAGLGLGYVLLVPFALDEALLASASAEVVQYVFITAFVLSLIGNVGGATTLLALGASEAPMLGSIARRSATVIGALTLVVSAAGLVSLDIVSVATLAFFPFEVWVLATSLSIVRHHGSAVPSAAAAA